MASAHLSQPRQSAKSTTLTLTIVERSPLPFYADEVLIDHPQPTELVLGIVVSDVPRLD
jgi:hypothetical protein